MDLELKLIEFEIEIWFKIMNDEYGNQNWAELN